MKTQEIILGQTTYEISRFFREDKTTQELVKERIIQNLAKAETVDEPPKMAV